MIREDLRYKYPCVSAGYLGVVTSNATLNSAFYFNLLSNISYMDDILIFPQRILKRDFFEEINFLEGKKYANNFQFICNKILIDFDSLSSSKNIHSIKLINLLNLMLRYGLFEKICEIDDGKFKQLLDDNTFFEVSLLIEIARFKLNNDEVCPVLLINLHKLAELLLSGKRFSNRIQILAFNFFIVLTSRYGIKFDNSTYLNKFIQNLIDLIESNHDADLGSVIRKSVAFRGLAMVKEIGEDLQNEYLGKALFFARNAAAVSVTIQQKIITNENLYTCLQSFSKWNTHKLNFISAENNLVEMIKIDPSDSTAYGELGFLLLDQEREHEALKAFEKAAKLGPPAVGMHTYYWAKCLQIIGRDEEAEKLFYEVTLLDEEAVSPWVDLIEYYLKVNNFEFAKNIAIKIFNHHLYKQQLTEEELLMIVSLIKK